MLSFKSIFQLSPTQFIKTQPLPKNLAFRRLQQGLTLLQDSTNPKPQS